MINTSSSVQPRVVIFHMTASQLIRSIAPISEARAMPNFVATQVLEKRWVSRKSISPENVERVETVECVRSYAEEVAAQYVKHLLGLSSALLAS
jgi:vacuolar-type H+-ATPase subunit B/Vma2